MAPRETGNNAYVKFLGDKQRALWYVMVFLDCGQYLESTRYDRPKRDESSICQRRLTK